MMGKARENWLCYLDQDGCHDFLVLMSEEEVRRAYALYREGRVLEAAQALKGTTVVVYEVDEALWEDLRHAFPDRAWRSKGLPLDEEEIIRKRLGDPVLFLRGEPYEAEKMPVAVLSSTGWDYWGENTKLHYTLTVDERLLAMEPIEGPLK